MLLQFVVQNFLSFRDEIVFKMTPTSDSHHLSHVESFPGHKIRSLKTAAIYGANASGKTNLVMALAFLKNLVVDGVKPTQGIPIQRFKLDRESLLSPTRFELEMVIRDTFYSYGIIVDDRRVREEWLFATKPDGREVRIFERITTEKNEVKVEIGPQLADSEHNREFLLFVARGTRPEQPFLTEAETRNVKSVQCLMEWFRKGLTIISPFAIYNSLPLRIHHDKKFTEALGFFLKSAGTGIERIGTEEVDLVFEKHFPGMPIEIRQEILSSLDGKQSFVFTNKNEDLTLIKGTKEKPKIIRVFTIHKGSEEVQIPFSFPEESSGTKRAIHLFPALFTLVESEGVFVIDELDRSLHPMLSRRFLETFLHFSKKNSQLIFTTHEASLLDLELLRRDEIWFIEKNKEQASQCYPLTDFKIRPDLEIRKGYLNGRFGAIPFFQDINSLGWVSDKE